MNMKPLLGRLLRGAAHSPAPQSRRARISTQLLTPLFLAGGLLGILHHEMWRDELQAWLIARDSVSVSDLFHNLRYESSPGLWHLGLFTITRVTANPVAMQVYHLLLATGVVYLFTRFSPFTNLQKAMFPFGYFFLFEYALISRSYVLGVLLIFAFCAFFKRRTRRYWPLAAILCLLANTSVYGLMVAVAMGAALLFECLSYEHARRFLNRKKVDIVASLLLCVLGLGTATIQIWPPSDLGRPATREERFTLRRLVRDTELAVVRSYVPVPQLTYHFWETNLVEQSALRAGGVPAINRIGFTVMGLGLLVWSVLLLAWSPVPLVLYLVGALELILFRTLVLAGGVRHDGHLFVLFLACLWLAADDAASTDAARRSTLKNWSMVTVLLLGQLGAGVFAYGMDLIYPFSAGKGAAEHIVKVHMDHLPIIGVPDYAVSPLSAYLRGKIFFPERDRYGTFGVWNNKKKPLSAPLILDTAIEHVLQRNVAILLIVDFKVEASSPDVDIVEIAESGPAIVPDESYLFVYLIRPHARVT